MMRVCLMSDVWRHLFVCRVHRAYVEKSRTERPTKTKIGTVVAHVTCDWTPLSKSKGQLAGGGAYCGGLPHTLFLNNFVRRQSILIKFGIQHRKETCYKIYIFLICPPCLKTVTSLSYENRQSRFNNLSEMPNLLMRFPKHEVRFIFCTDEKIITVTPLGKTIEYTQCPTVSHSVIMSLADSRLGCTRDASGFSVVFFVKPGTNIDGTNCWWSYIRSIADEVYI